MSLRLQTIEISAFRGFAKPRTINLDADAIVIVGPNGVGKTSLIDAVCWALTGRLPHLETWRRRMNEEVVISKYAAGASARVILHVSVHGQPVAIDRSGDSFTTTVSVLVNGNVLPVAEGERAVLDAVGVQARDQLLDAINRWVLRQEEVRAILQASPDELHRRLRDVLNLGQLDEFEGQLADIAAARSAELRETRSTLAEAERVAGASRSNLTTLEDRIQRSSGPDSAFATLEETIGRVTPLVAVDLAEARMDLASVLTALRATYDSMRVSSPEIQRLTAELGKQFEGPDLDLASRAKVEAEASLDRLTVDVAGAKATLQRAEMDSDQRQLLAAAAIPFLADVCPVCGQEIIRDEVLKRLQSLDHSGEAAAIVNARLQVDAALVAHSGEERAVLEARRIHAQVQEAFENRSKAISSLESLWGALNDSTAQRFSLTALAGRDASLLPPTMTALVELGQAVRTVVEASQLSSLSEIRQSLGIEVQRAGESLARARVELEAAARRANESARLLKAVREGGVRVVDRAMTAVNPRFSEVYRRLAPHPTFTDLGFTHDFYRSKGRSMPIVVDPLAEVEANPSVVCSVGQLNVVALSYFLAFAISDASNAMPFVIMDDPLQSLDDVNALGLADFCRRLKRERQVVITTHDERFGELLRRKLQPRISDETMLAINLPAWDRDGPTVDAHAHAYLDAQLSA